MRTAGLRSKERMDRKLIDAALNASNKNARIDAVSQLFA